jgi:SAM-dependent methyltransferase
MVREISDSQRRHYSSTYREFGNTPQGVDWSSDRRKAELRYQLMLNAISNSGCLNPSLIDVGCGFGGLLEYAKSNNYPVTYTGVDLVGEMIDSGNSQFPESRFILGDFLELAHTLSADFVVCNGILTQKLEVSTDSMIEYFKALTRAMFDAAEVGIAFNVMTQYSNYYAENLFYLRPEFVLNWCLENLSNRVKIDHSYPLYEFTTYVYK